MNGQRGMPLPGKALVPGSAEVVAAQENEERAHETEQKRDREQRCEVGQSIEGEHAHGDGPASDGGVERRAGVAPPCRRLRVKRDRLG